MLVEQFSFILYRIKSEIAIPFDKKTEKNGIFFYKRAQILKKQGKPAQTAAISRAPE